MSNLYKQLGPQGRALLNSRSQSFQPGVRDVVYEHDHPVPQDLDFLVHELRDPFPDTSTQKIMGFMYHYLPFIKMEYNLRVVVSSFLNNPVTFGPVAAPFEENYHIIELFRAVAEKKLKVSQPTLSIKTWYTVVTRELVNFVAYNPLQNSWKALPVVAGLMLAKGVRGEVCSGVEYGLFFRETDQRLLDLFIECLRNSLTGYQSEDIINLVLLAYAVVFNKNDENVKIYTGNVAPEFMVSRLVELIFSPKYTLNANAYRELLAIDRRNPEAEKQVQEILLLPVVRNLNKLSFLLEAYLDDMPFTSKSLKLVETALLSVLHFNKELYNRTSSSFLNLDPLTAPQTAVEGQCWFFYKSILFVEVIMFQGVLSRLLKARQPRKFWFSNATTNDYTSETRDLSFMILHNLFYVNFILLSVGQGGFDNYNFVYYLAVELALNSPHVEQMELFTNNIVNDPSELKTSPELLNVDYLATSKVLFVLGLWESYVQHKNTNARFIRNIIYPFCWRIVTNIQFKNIKIIEGCHSVLLICFSNGSLKSAFREILDYISVLDAQFPNLLSAQQLSIAIESVGKRLLSSPLNHESSITNSGEELLNFWHFRSANTTAGIKIPKHALNTMESFSSSRPDMKITSPATMSNSTTAPSKTSFEYEMTDRLAPETTREAKIIAFIRLVPYIPLSIFEQWLNKILVMIEHSTSSESDYLIKMFWKLLSENLDTNRNDLAVRWWYEQKHIPESGVLKSFF